MALMAISIGLGVLQVGGALFKNLKLRKQRNQMEAMNRQSLAQLQQQVGGLTSGNTYAFNSVSPFMANSGMPGGSQQAPAGYFPGFA